MVRAVVELLARLPGMSSDGRVTGKSAIPRLGCWLNDRVAPGIT
jgi:hypothetical protein